MHLAFPACVVDSALLRHIFEPWWCQEKSDAILHLHIAVLRAQVSTIWAHWVHWGLWAHWALKAHWAHWADRVHLGPLGPFTHLTPFKPF